MICSNDMGGSIQIEPGAPYFFLADVDGTELYLVQKEYVSLLLQDELYHRYVGVSNVHSGLESLKVMYREALYARKEAFWKNRQTYYYGEANITEKRTMHLEDQEIMKMVQMLGTDKYEESIRKLERLFKNASLGSYPHQEIEEGMAQFLQEIRGTYEGVLNKENLDMDAFFKLYSFSCMEEYKAELIGWVTNLAEILNQKFDDFKNKQKMKQAIEYIRENYNKELNMAVVSNYISMNYSLFSFAFKQYTGTNFVNYLKEIRIKKAKELLESTDLKIIEISCEVGYENEKHFMKTFKAVCGVSPSEYRKNAQLKG